MEMHNVSLRGLKVDALAHELATSNNGARLEAALKVVRDLPLE